MVSAEDVQPKKKGGSPFVMMAVFLVVLLIMFDNNLRIATGEYVGYALNPVAALWGFDILWTLLFAASVMILSTTIIRHFLVDWVHMARVQEVMRTFQKEFSAARKSNNSYQIKRLTDVQPEIMKLQADMSSGQLKPMAYTMLLVIPIFAWLSTLTLAPVAYAAVLDGGTDPFLLLATGPDAQEGLIVAGDEGAVELLHASDLYAFALPGSTPAGDLTLTHPVTGRETSMPLSGAASPEWSNLVVGELDAGTYRVKPEGDQRVVYSFDEDEHNTLSHVIVAVPQSGNLANARAAFVNGNGAVLQVPEASTIYALIPVAAGTEPRGGITDAVRPADADNVLATWDVSVEGHLVSTSPESAAHARVVPHAAQLPWNPASDLNGSWWVMPHWILLYSLFSIPIGQITQKILKLIEYSKVDLDSDGKAPGLSME